MFLDVIQNKLKILLENFSQHPVVCGVEDVGDCLKIALIHKQSIETKTLHKDDLTDVKQLYKLSQHPLFITALNTQNTLIRHLDVNQTKDRAIQAVLKYQLEPIIPYPIEEAVFDSIVLKKNKEDSSLIVFASNHNILKEHLYKYPVNPTAISCIPQALASFLASYPSIVDPVLIVHATEKTCCCVLVFQGKALAAREFAVGTNLKAPETEISKTIHSYGLQFPKHHPQHILLTGENSFLQHLQVSRPLLPLPKHPFLKEPTETLIKYAAPLGLALSTGSSINLKKDSSPSFLHSPYLKKPLLSYFVLSCLVALLLVFLGQLFLDNKIKRWHKNYTDILSKIENSTSYTPKPSNLTKTNKMTLESMSLAVDDLNKKIYAIPDTFPLTPSIPSVSDVLAWINNHEKISSVDNHKLINIDKIVYTLTQRPGIKQKNKPYQAKVEIFFTSSVPQRAREFHEALLSPNEIINPKSDISWHVNGNNYHTSFFLKDNKKL